MASQSPTSHPQPHIDPPIDSQSLPSSSSHDDASGARGSSGDGGGQDRGSTDREGHLGRSQEGQAELIAQGEQPEVSGQVETVSEQGPSGGAPPPGLNGLSTVSQGGRQHQLLPPSLGSTSTGARKAKVVVQTEAQQPLSPTVANAADSDDDGPQSEDGDGDFLSDFPDNTPELDLIHCRLGSCSTLHLPRFGPYLTRLCLRQNHIKSLDSPDWHPLVELDELDLYDNQLKQLGDALVHCTKLESLDLSFNLFRGVPDGLASLSELRTIFFVQNKITRIDNLSTFTSLRTLELGGNRIRQIENLDALVNLEELWLGKNKIAKLENLDTLAKLRILSIQANRITKLENLAGLVGLEELYISHNGIAKLEGLEHNLKLRTLDVGSNRLTAIENIAHLADLEELWASSNAIPDLTGLQRECACMKELATVYFEHNPAQRVDMTGYRRKVILALPQIKQIDATYVRAT